MNVLIIEDEIPAAKRLAKLLKETDPGLNVVATVGSIAAGVAFLSGQPAVDLLFSDIHLSDGLCFEIYKQVEPPGPIIFTTAYDDYAIQAFKHNSLDYLLKPIMADELKAALQKLGKMRQTQAPGGLTSQSVEQLIRSLTQPPRTYRERFLVTHKETFVPIPSEEVAYFYSENKLTRLVRPDGRWFVLPETLEELTDQLDPRQFFRANRQFIVSSGSVRTIHKHFNGKLKLVLTPDPTEEVMVSRERAEEFKQWLNQ